MDVWMDDLCHVNILGIIFVEDRDFSRSDRRP